MFRSSAASYCAVRCGGGKLTAAGAVERRSGSTDLIRVFADSNTKTKYV
jgi:hypothetical protein